MTKRFTETNKWEDKWFRSLGRAEKLLFVFICDKCSIGGFWEIDTELAAFFTGLDESSVQGALKGLQRAYKQVGSILWLKNFLKHQGNLPLNPQNPAHRGIIRDFTSHSEFKINCLKLTQSPTKGPSKGLKRPISISKGIGNGKSKGKEYSALFLEFWQSYPRKTDKVKAFGIFQRKEIDRALLDRILKALHWQRDSKSWAEGFIPHPSTYLNGDRWEDEPAKALTPQEIRQAEREAQMKRIAEKRKAQGND